MMTDAETQELAMRVVNLRRALKQANRCIEAHADARGLKGYLTVSCNETQGPTFREGRKFWAEVRRVAAGGEDGEQG